MERRKFLFGVGSAAVGTSALVGSGAFSFVRAERDMTVEVVNDKDAYLGLDATTSEYAKYNNGQLSLDFGTNSEGGEGLNDNADSRFDDVFKIKNQGTNDVGISFHDTEGAVGYSSPGATWYYSETSGWEDNKVNGDNPPVLTPGDEIFIHVIFWLTDYDEDDLPDHLGIVAEE